MIGLAKFVANVPVHYGDTSTPSSHQKTVYMITAVRKVLRGIGARLLRGALQLWWPVLGRCKRNRNRKHVLLCASTDLMAEYLHMVADLLRHDARLEIFLTAPPLHPHLGSTAKALARRVGATHAGYISARFKWWDVIVFADHASAKLFHPAIPRVLVYHSLTSGFMAGGQSYRYGHNAIRQDGKPVFTRMFEPSEAARERALRINPALRDALVVVGDLRADKMLSMRSERDQLRMDMGFGPDDRVILIQSTWGPASLMETIGRELVEEASRIAKTGAYHFIVSTHPNHFNGPYAQRNPWGKFLLDHEAPGMHVRRPGTPWEPYLVAADVAITDYTGLCVAFALLQRPMLFVPVVPGTVDPSSLEWSLYQTLPRLENPHDLREAIIGAFSHYPTDTLAAVSSAILSCAGEAKQRIQDELLRVMRLS